MSLRTRLWLVLGVVFLIPLAVALVLLTLAIPKVLSDQTAASLGTDRAVVVDQLRTDCAQMGLAARGVALEAGADTPRQAVETVVGQRYADYGAVLGPAGVVVAEAGTLPPATTGADLASCSRGETFGSSLAERVPVQGVTGARAAVTAIRLTPGYLAGLRQQDRFGDAVEIAVLDGRRVLASTLDPGIARRLAAALGSPDGPASVGTWLVDAAGPSTGVPFTVAVAQPRPDINLQQALLIVGLAAVALLAAGLLVNVIVRALTRPLSELTDAAERVAKGDLDTRIRAAGGEVGRLSEAFNRMTVELRRNMSALEQSRGDLRDSIERIGNTLTSTLDLDALLQVVLETAVVTLPARVGVVLYRAADEVRLVADHGLHEAGLVAPVGVRPGVGVLGKVISSGRGVRGQLRSGSGLSEPSDTEPADGDILAVPLRSKGTVQGVIALYDRVDGHRFNATDEDAMRTLVGQASIAIDNVMLHQEAHRLSITDGLTGVRNFRYLSTTLAREIERSSRFDRPLAVLMLDLDHFKRVNDTYGHPRGDAVLRELAQRVQEQVREIDTFARYGGEEFVVVLPETTVEGATQLAGRICRAVRSKPFTHDGEEPLKITVSIGGAAFPLHGSSAATLMRAADKALYVAKHEGRDRWHMADR